ncbi:MBL fold metallo-hydrolase [Mesorhizobium sp. M0309]|uniref:MBL fold metallo-hydrolase n=1 Tax=Mesorhizobium sp. M0309 TaxID=2956933 RepID=UPI00333AB867
MYEVEWIQYPVGHGGFHVGTARIDSEPSPFTWMFDCGSRANVKLDIFLRSWTLGNPTPIDWLFLSHFDKDHVSGVDELMNRSAVRSVMLPYVNIGELALTLLEEAGRDRLHRWFVDLVADPAGWLLGRGAGRVLFLRGGEPGVGEEGIPFEPSPPDRKRDGWAEIVTPIPQSIAADITSGIPQPGAHAAIVDALVRWRRFTPRATV